MLKGGSMPVCIPGLLIFSISSPAFNKLSATVY